jgi:hypothetical protein
VVSRRISIALGALVAAFAVAGDASASYGWPVKPFDRQHPIRGGFGDPRTVFRSGLFGDPWAGPGEFSFHNGLDIAAPGNTPVYAVASGVVHPTGVSALELDARLPGQRRVFQYDHIKIAVVDGQVVTARRTILGWVLPSAGHVHLAEIYGYRITNPLLKGHLTPYRDRTRPRVISVGLSRAGSAEDIGSLNVCGRVTVSAEAYDVPAMQVPKPWNGLPIAPALVTWKLTKLDGTELVPGRTAADFRKTLPANGQFWSIYARGTYQNAPRFGVQQFGAMPGRFLYKLAASLDTSALPNGVALITVAARDERGNVGAATRRISIQNHSLVAACPDPPVTTTTTTTP